MESQKIWKQIRRAMFSLFLCYIYQQITLWEGAYLVMQNLHILVVATVLVYMVLWYIVSLALKRNDAADVDWGGGFIVGALTALASQGEITPRALLVAALVITWGVRLSLHI